MNQNRIWIARTARLAFVFTAGCAGPDGVSLDAKKPLDPGVDPVVVTAAPEASVSPPPGALPEPPHSEAKRETKPASSAAAPPPPRSPAVAKPGAVKSEPAHAAQQKETPPAAGAAHPAPVPAARATERTLDVTDLKTRLRETNAIGVFTKLALKNQMDDLLDRFRAVYQNGQKSGVAALRRPFDALVAKVLTQLQAGDPSLARTIETSREAIWGILSDPEKFKSVS